MRSLILSCCLLLPLSVASADVFYCDPVNGSTTKGDGSATKPWGTLESVVSAKLINGADATKGKIHAGDTVKLRTGIHGKPNMQGPEYSAMATITVEADDGHKPVLMGCFCNGLRNWTFRNISVQSPDAELTKWTKIWTMANASNVLVEGCEIRTAADATQWTDREWETRCAWYGLWTSGVDIKVSKCWFFGLENCLVIDGGDRVEFDQNTIEYFINDGIEYTGNNIRITRNRITDLYHLKSNGFHHDGIQGWNFAKTPLKNIVIEDNFIAYSTGRYPKVPPIAEEAIYQGIVCFDGSWKDVSVRGNTVKVTGFHAISLYEAADSVIENNTVVYQGPAGRKEGPPWIGVFPRTVDGAVVTEPKNVVIKSNIAPTYNLFPRGVSVENCFSFQAPQKPWNAAFTIVEPSKTFRVYDPPACKFDLTTREDSPAAGRLKTIRVDGAGALVNN